MKTTFGCTGLTVKSGCWATSQSLAAAMTVAGCSTSACVKRNTSARAKRLTTPRHAVP